MASVCAQRSAAVSHIALTWRLCAYAGVGVAALCCAIAHGLPLIRARGLRGGTTCGADEEALSAERSNASPQLPRRLLAAYVSRSCTEASQRAWHGVERMTEICTPLLAVSAQCVVCCCSFVCRAATQRCTPSRAPALHGCRTGVYASQTRAHTAHSPSGRCDLQRRAELLRRLPSPGRRRPRRPREACCLATVSRRRCCTCASCRAFGDSPTTWCCRCRVLAA